MEDLVSQFESLPHWAGNAAITAYFLACWFTGSIVANRLSPHGYKGAMPRLVGDGILGLLFAPLAPMLWIAGALYGFYYGVVWPPSWLFRKVFARRTKTVSGETIELEVSMNVNQINAADTATGANQDIVLKIGEPPASEPMLTPVKREYEVGDWVRDLTIMQRGVGIVIEPQASDGEYRVRFPTMAGQLTSRPPDCIERVHLLKVGSIVTDAAVSERGPGVVEKYTFDGRYLVRFQDGGPLVALEESELKRTDHIAYEPDATTVPDAPAPYAGSKPDPLSAPATMKDIAVARGDASLVGDKLGTLGVRVDYLERALTDHGIEARAAHN